MGWTADDDPLAHLELKFDSFASAVRYAERQQLNYRVQNAALSDAATGSCERALSKPALFVDAAATVAVLAISRGEPGIYNITEDDGAVSSDKARRELGFDSEFRIKQ